MFAVFDVSLNDWTPGAEAELLVTSLYPVILTIGRGGEAEVALEHATQIKSVLITALTGNLVNCPFRAQQQLTGPLHPDIG